LRGREWEGEPALAGQLGFATSVLPKGRNFH
jgi:hypothetical protein